MAESYLETYQKEFAKRLAQDLDYYVMKNKEYFQSNYKVGDVVEIGGVRVEITQQIFDL